MLRSLRFGARAAPVSRSRIFWNVSNVISARQALTARLLAECVRLLMFSSFVLLHPASATGVAVFTNHNNGHRVIDPVFRAVTGREHRVFSWA